MIFTSSQDGKETQWDIRLRTEGSLIDTKEKIVIVSGMEIEVFSEFANFTDIYTYTFHLNV
jgi:hypothetical protein